MIKLAGNGMPSPAIYAGLDSPKGGQGRGMRKNAGSTDKNAGMQNSGEVKPEGKIKSNDAECNTGFKYSNGWGFKDTTVDHKSIGGVFITGL